jgi:hypothetical protein
LDADSGKPASAIVSHPLALAATPHRITTATAANTAGAIDPNRPGV